MTFSDIQYFMKSYTLFQNGEIVFFLKYYTMIIRHDFFSMNKETITFQD